MIEYAIRESIVIPGRGRHNHKSKRTMSDDIIAGLLPGRISLKVNTDKRAKHKALQMTKILKPAKFRKNITRECIINLPLQFFQ